MRVSLARGLRIDSKVQRRRRKKAEPKNIFGTGSQSPSSSKQTKARRPQTPRQKIQRAPPSVPGAKPKVVVKKPEPVDDEPKEDAAESVENPIVVEPVVVEEPEKQDEGDEEPEEDPMEEQILGAKSKKDIGLSKSETKEPDEDSVEDDGKSLKAREIIKSSMLKASRAVEDTEKPSKPKTAEPTPVEPAAIQKKKPQRKFRNKISSYQPASRAKRLDRSRHMEYKYEMRRLLVDIAVSEEHRSNLLATTWARGERQTTNEAKNFLEEKLIEGVIDEGQMNSLLRIVEAYTIRR